MTNRTLSVVIPVFNGARTIPTLLSRLQPVLASNADAFEVILVDDHSGDDSWTAVCELARVHPFVVGLRLMRNYGQHNAVLCGIRTARYDTIVTLDDDLQHPAEEIPALLAKLGEGYDVVYGTPIRQQHGLRRDMASAITKFSLQVAMGAETARMVSAFRAFRTDLRKAFQSYESPFVSIDVLLTWGTTAFAAVPVTHLPRESGQSNYSFRRLVTHAVNMVTGFTVLPLQLASIIGFGLTVLGFALLAFVVGRWLLEGDIVPGFPFLASTIALFSGAQLFALGIIGEYLARMHFRIMARPAYVVERVCSVTERKEGV
jgi:undecaprenyl-phosphate 4-deoxy-4-formamido-L-arabinose transferase